MKNNDDLVNIGERGITRQDGKYLKNSMQIAALPDVDTNDAQQVAERVAEYFEITSDNEVRASLEGLALSLGVSRQTISRWASNEQKPPEVRKMLKKAIGILNMQMVDLMQNGQINNITGIFLMKNNYQYSDQSEILITPHNPLGELDEDGLKNKYIKSIPEITE